jgi:hypothetical protein
MVMKFITDNGGPHSLRDEGGNTLGEIPRYGVWGQTGRGKPQVIECHNDLALLQATHAATRCLTNESSSFSQDQAESRWRKDTIGGCVGLPL